MIRCSVAAFGILSLAPFLPTSSSAAEHEAIRLLPETTVLYAEVSNPPKLLSTIFDNPLAAKIQETEPWQQAIRKDDYRNFLAGRKFVEIQLGMEWREALDTLLAQGVYFGVDSKTQGVAVLVRARDAASMDLFRAKLLELTKLGKNPDQIKEGEYRGLTVYDANKAKFAVVDEWLLITNKPETGKDVLDRLLDSGDDCLAENQQFKTAVAARDSNDTFWAFADLTTIRNAGVAKKLFAGKSENPAVELLIGGILSSLQQTPYATASVTASKADLSLALSIPHNSDWVPEEREFYFGPGGEGQSPALPEVRDTLFTLSTYRDVSEMWLRAGDLFNEQINDGFAEADANLTTLFAGRDFGEDILGSLTPEIGFIASKQDFTDILPVPAIKLPQFALVVELRDPEKMTRELRRTYQSMIGFFNVIGAMEGRPQFEMGMEKLDDAELVTATYVPEEDDAESTNADIIFNFSPSVGFAEERFVVASTDRLARELVSAQAPRVAAESANTTASLQAAVLKDVLEDNREQLISQNMLEEGNSREEAEAAIGLFLDFIDHLDDASLKLQAVDDNLSLKFQLRVKE